LWCGGKRVLLKGIERKK